MKWSELSDKWTLGEVVREVNKQLREFVPLCLTGNGIRGSVTVTGGAWTAVSFGKTFAAVPVVCVSSSHATALPHVRAVTVTGCEVNLSDSASGTVQWAALQIK
jgi:hypothetical protein